MVLKIVYFLSEYFGNLVNKMYMLVQNNDRFSIDTNAKFSFRLIIHIYIDQGMLFASVLLIVRTRINVYPTIDNIEKYRNSLK